MTKVIDMTTTDFFQVNAASASYKVHFFRGEEAIVSLENQVKMLLQKHSKLAVITDENIKNCYEKQWNPILEQFPKNLLFIPVPAGEISKSREQKQAIEDILLKHGFDRKSAIMALGGGVVGDLSGFIASTYMRGIDFYQMPTSLLAMSDSSVGGKTGVNTSFGKNLIGTIYQPCAVFNNAAFLKTLPSEEMINGMSEVIKFGIIFDKDLFDFCQKNSSSFFQLDQDFLSKIIKETVSLKGNVVAKDEREQGLRKSLNYGHTVGHALERMSQFRLKHGVAIAWGMVVETALAQHLGFAQQGDVAAVREILAQYQLPINIHDLRKILDDPSFTITGKDLYAAMILDKKSKSKEVHMTMLKKIGELENFDDEYIFGIKEESFVSFFDNGNF